MYTGVGNFFWGAVLASWVILWKKAARSAGAGTGLPVCALTTKILRNTQFPVVSLSLHAAVGTGMLRFCLKNPCQPGSFRLKNSVNLC